MKVFDDLEARGLVKQTTNTEKIRSLLNDDKITFYIGFDPTADSLHVGHLLGLVTARRLSDAGHKAIMLIGGATAEVGDPTGKNEMRKMLDRRDLWANEQAIQFQIKNIVPKGIPVNNNVWFKHASNMSFLEFIKEVGPHFSVNTMLRAECFKSRMETGLTFLEFNYMVMQAFDFFRLTTWFGADCKLQLGGDDQWSNMLAGIDLVRKKSGKEVFALTFPLLVNSDGKKMGKTEKGAVWLDPNKTSPFDFFQFWRNIEDAKVRECINFFTDHNPYRPFDELSNINEAKKFLAFEVTKLVHGQEEAEKALKQAQALFENHDTSKMEAISITEGTPLLDVLISSGFTKSRTESRKLIANRGISINNQVVINTELTLTAELGKEFVLRKGKKSFVRFQFKEE